MSDKFTVKRRNTKERAPESCMLKTYAAAGDMVDEIVDITHKTKSQIVYDMIKYAYDHLEVIEEE